MIELSDDVGAYGTDWTVVITEGSITSDDSIPCQLGLSDDASGVIEFSDGAEIRFDGIEEIQWL